MLKIKALAVGKCKELWLKDALSQYEKRLSPMVDLEWVILGTDAALKGALATESQFVVLDPKGVLLDSPAFSSKLMKWLSEGGSRLTLVIGGPEGIPEEISRKAFFRLSFSPLTFTHQMVRLILIEQIYRAFEIMKGSPYHK